MRDGHPLMHETCCDVSRVSTRARARGAPVARELPAGCAHEWCFSPSRPRACGPSWPTWRWRHSRCLARCPSTASRRSRAPSTSPAAQPHVERSPSVRRTLGLRRRAAWAWAGRAGSWRTSQGVRGYACTATPPPSARAAGAAPAASMASSIATPATVGSSRRHSATTPAGHAPRAVRRASVKRAADLSTARHQRRHRRLSDGRRHPRPHRRPHRRG